MSDTIMMEKTLDAILDELVAIRQIHESRPVTPLAIQPASTVKAVTLESTYPYDIEVSHRDECIYDKTGTIVFLSSGAEKWERQICAILDTTKRYQMHITFVEIEE